MLRKKNNDNQKQNSTSQSNNNVNKQEIYDFNRNNKLNEISDYNEEYSLDITSKDITANKARSNNNASRNSLQAQKNAQKSEPVELGQDMISTRLEGKNYQPKDYQNKK